MIIEIDNAVLKEGESLVIQRRTANEVDIEELFRWVKPVEGALQPSSTIITHVKVELKKGVE